MPARKRRDFAAPAEADELEDHPIEMRSRSTAALCRQGFVAGVGAAAGAGVAEAAGAGAGNTAINARITVCTLAIAEFTAATTVGLAM